jgi:electron transfer flavoprotein alpha subunit
VRGIAPARREVGLGARHVAPQLYVVVGASGSAGHLAAVAADAEIIAIDANPDAPIFKVASYGLVGDLAELVPALIAALGGPRATAEAS